MVDYPDFDELIQTLLFSAIQASQKFTGKLYQPSEVTVYTNSSTDVFPLPNSTWYTPVESEPIPNSYDGSRKYTYPSGYEEGKLPADLKQAVLQRVAEGFKHRENSVSEAVNQTVNASVFIEFSYRDNPMF